MFAKILPLIVMTGLAIHSQDEIKEKLAKITSIKGETITKQRMSAIFKAAKLDFVAGFESVPKSQSGVRRWVRKKVHIPGNKKDDPTLDGWAQPLRFGYGRGILGIASNGPDQKPGGNDDIQRRENIQDY